MSGVNSSITKFEKKKTEDLLSDIFTVSDEAFAIIIIINELHAWKEYLKEKNLRILENMKRKFVQPQSGKN